MKSLFFLFIPCVVFAQQQNDLGLIRCSFVKPDSFQVQTQSEDLVYNIVEKMPRFPAVDENSIVRYNEDTLLHFLRDNFQYSKADTAGRIIVGFVVNENGNVINPIIKHGLTPVLNEEALRVVQMMKFQPGKQWSKAVKVNYTLPIIIKQK